MYSGTPVVKIVIIGDVKVGKSCLMKRFVSNEFIPAHDFTIGVDFGVKHLHTQTYGEVKVHVWDTAGQERFRSITKAYYRAASVCIVVYDVCSKSSRLGVDGWIREARQHLPKDVVLAVAGNKCDRLEIVEAIRDKTGETLEVEEARCYKVSALAGTGVHEMFEDLVDTVCLQRNCGRATASDVVSKLHASKGSCC